MRGPRTTRTNRARSLRSVATAAEMLLWRRIRDRQLADFEFVRQAPVGRYYVDFLFRDARLSLKLTAVSTRKVRLTSAG